MGLIIFLINMLVNILLILLLVRMFISFTNLDPYHPIRRWVYNLTEPLLAPIRRYLPTSGGLDFSPLILILIVYGVRALLFSFLV